MVERRSDHELVRARECLAAATGDREKAQREADEIGRAYAAAEEHLRTASAAEAQARLALRLVEDAARSG